MIHSDDGVNVKSGRPVHLETKQEGSNECVIQIYIYIYIYIYFFFFFGGGGGGVKIRV